MNGAWTTSEHETLLKLCESGIGWPAISSALGRTIPACKFQHARLSRGFAKRIDNRPRKTDRAGKPLTHAEIKASASAEADRRARANLNPSSITAAIFGDPLPGRSALDMRNSKSTQPAGCPANMEA